MSVIGEKIAWITREQSVAGLARRYGIPYRQLLAVRSGQLSPGRDFLKQLNKVYSAESYRILRAEGVGRVQAGRLRGAALSRVTQVQEFTRAVVHEWTSGAVLSIYGDEWEKMSAKRRKEEEAVYAEKIREGLRQSYKEIEQTYRDERS